MGTRQQAQELQAGLAPSPLPRQKGSSPSDIRLLGCVFPELGGLKMSFVCFWKAEVLKELPVSVRRSERSFFLFFFFFRTAISPRRWIQEEWEKAGKGLKALQGETAARGFGRKG